MEITIRQHVGTGLHELAPCSLPETQETTAVSRFLPAAQLHLTRVLLARGQPAEATAQIEQLLQRDPEDVMARFHLDALEKEDGPAQVPADDVVRAIYADESVGRNLEGSLQGQLTLQQMGSSKAESRFSRRSS